MFSLDNKYVVMDDTKITTEKTSLIDENNRVELYDTKTKGDIVMCVRKKTKKQLRTYGIIRLSFMVLIILIAMFLLIYSSYLIALQFLTNLARKYNMKLMDNTQIMFEIDLNTYMFNSTCTQTLSPIDCVALNLCTLKAHGVTDVILKNIFEYDFSLVEKVGDKESLRRLLEEAELVKIGVYLDTARERLKIAAVREEIDISEALRDWYESLNKTCIDGYRHEIITTVEKYATWGADGFIIHDIPCCVIYQEHFEGLKNPKPGNCSFESIFEIRKVARKRGKPSSIIYQPTPKMYPNVMDLLSKRPQTFFDAVVNYISISNNGSVDIEENITRIFPHNIWTLNVKNISVYLADRYLYDTILTFTPGSTIYQPHPDIKAVSPNLTDDEIATKRFADDLKHLGFVSRLKKNLINNSCVSNRSWHVQQYSGDQIFIAFLPIHLGPMDYCVLAVNFGETQTDVKTQIKLEEKGCKVAKGIDSIIVLNDGRIVRHKDVLTDMFTIPPKTAKVINIMRENLEDK
ncbi:hypothetical protein RF11_09829 [Thelohanellus kitauei]|uniref:Uncharacterized protein n=1 Tax=Thelohanellus kitauei TaxID=669202 RepID=A0A0C2N0X2_THEKT|nr:hypothetical protein RF11_09829 [Thelohanellus kitauei]